MKRNIIKIDEAKCNGCGICIDACHEGALQLIDGKAKLVSESYCDGLGDCLPECPTDAITIEKREAEAFDEEAVKKHIEKNKAIKTSPLACGCPSTHSKTIERKQAPQKTTESNEPVTSQLKQWPCQIQLVPPNAPYFNNAHLLVAADCSAFAYGSIHNDFMKNKITLIGCPKLDHIDYSKKLTDIIKMNNIKSVTVLKMEVPCCSGLSGAVTKALQNSGKMIPWHIVTIGTDGSIIEE